jgi:hypothetical protein
MQMRKFLFFSIIVAGINAVAQFPTTSLTVSYPFTNGSVNDVSGYNNHLTAFNGPTPCADRFNNPNCAYQFDGINDYMKAINPGPMNHKSRSLVFWAKTTAPFNSDGYAVLYYGDGYNGGARVEYGLNSTCNSFYIDYGYGFVSKPFATTDNMWHMYAAVYDSTISYGITSVKYYVDANLIGTNCYTYNPTQVINTQPLDPIYVGRFTSSLPRYFSGALDDIHVYERPLTPGEIVTIYTFPNTVSEHSPGEIHVTVLPNPAHDHIEVRADDKIDVLDIRNILGEQVYHQDDVSTVEQINISSLTSGMYLMEVRTKKGSSVTKFIKN